MPRRGEVNDPDPHAEPTARLLQDGNGALLRGGFLLRGQGRGLLCNGGFLRDLLCGGLASVPATFLIGSRAHLRRVVTGLDVAGRGKGTSTTGWEMQHVARAPRYLFNVAPSARLGMPRAPRNTAGNTTTTPPSDRHPSNAKAAPTNKTHVANACGHARRFRSRHRKAKAR